MTKKELMASRTFHLIEDRGFKYISKKEAKNSPPHSPSFLEGFYQEELAVMKLGDKMVEAIRRKR